MSTLPEVMEELTGRRPSGPHVGTLPEANVQNFAYEGRVNERASSREINGARYFAKEDARSLNPTK